MSGAFSLVVVGRCSRNKENGNIKEVLSIHCFACGTKNLPNLLNHPQGGLVEKLVRKRPMRELGRLRECGLPERWATLSRRFVFELSESPLQRQGGVDECVSIVVGVEDEVVADLHLSTNAEFCVF